MRKHSNKKEIFTMKNLLKSMKTRRHHLILDELDVIRVLRVLNKHKIYRHISIGNCGWEDTTKWFIHFDATDRLWDILIDELKIVRVWGCIDIPDRVFGVIYSTD
jgi:hypothetical protein